MLTLTYLCPPVNGKKAKCDLKAALQWLGRRFDGVEFVWWAEFTRAGAIHFHILLDKVPTDTDRKDFALYWYKRSDQGQGRYCHIRTKREMDVMESILSSVGHNGSWQKLKHTDGAKRYVGKYATKPHQKIVPTWFSDIGRFWGASNGVRRKKAEYKVVIITEDEVREILTKHNRKVGSWDVLPRYLWAVEEDWFKGL